MPGDIVPAVVVATSGGPAAPRAVAAGAILLRVGKYFVEVPKAGYAWTRKTSPDFVKVGDLVSVQVQSLDEATQFGTGRSNRTRRLKARCWRSTTRPGRFAR